MPGTTRKTPAKAAAADATPSEDVTSYTAPTSVEGLAAIVVELLEHVVLRDSDERAVLSAKLTGGEVPSADEAGQGEVDGEG